MLPVQCGRPMKAGWVSPCCVTALKPHTWKTDREVLLHLFQKRAYCMCKCVLTWSTRTCAHTHAHTQIQPGKETPWLRRQWSLTLWSSDKRTRALYMWVNCSDMASCVSISIVTVYIHSCLQLLQCVPALRCSAAIYSVYVETHTEGWFPNVCHLRMW